jgi:hypothetical protein
MQRQRRQTDALAKIQGTKHSKDALRAKPVLVMAGLDLDMVIVGRGGKVSKETSLAPTETLVEIQRVVRQKNAYVTGRHYFQLALWWHFTAQSTTASSG